MMTTRLRRIHLRPIHLICILIALGASSVVATSRPNVIMIMADDIGAEGLGCYGSQICTTPNLDRMASDGVRFGGEKGYFVRDQRFRLHEDGRLYDIPVTSDKERYSESESSGPEHESHRQRLQGILDAFMAITDEYGGATDSIAADERSKKE